MNKKIKLSFLGGGRNVNCKEIVKTSKKKEKRKKGRERRRKRKRKKVKKIEKEIKL
jgi:hypothetical protein